MPISKGKERLPRTCRECGVRFVPPGKFCFFCPDCLRDIKSQNSLNRRKTLKDTLYK